MDVKEILKELTEASGPSGKENAASAKAREMLSKYMETRVDASGNVIGQHEGEGRRILLDAHIDEIGMIVTCVCDGGFLKVSPVGGMDERIITAAKYTVWGQRPINAVACSTPPHLKGKVGEESADVILDTGLETEEAKSLIKLGDFVTFRQNFIELKNDRVTAKSLDDRAGIATLLRAVDLIFEEKKDANLAVLFSVQEEVGKRGASCAAFSVQPDEAIAVDVSFATAPDVPAIKSSPLSGGAMIGIAPILDGKMTEKLVRIVEENDIKYSTEIMSGTTGTNADDISDTASGIKTALISIPQRNMHTPVEIVSTEDIESAAKLIALYVCGNGGEK